MALEGIKHLVECNCILPQYALSKNPVFHKFIVFSVLDSDTQEIKEKYSQCPNCDIIHRVYDLCKSEILVGKEKLSSILTFDEISLSLPSKLVEILNKNNCQIYTWEEILFCFENQKYGSSITINMEYDIKNNKKYGKSLKILGAEQFKIEPFSTLIEVQ